MGQLKEYEALDDIGFIGNPRHKHTEKEAKIVGAFFRTLRAKRIEWLIEPTNEEVQQIMKDVENAYRRGQRAKHKQVAFD
jgi:hypothetical protein